jgi:lysophospholipase L1-like esterase
MRTVLLGDSHMEAAGLAPGLIDGLQGKRGLEIVAVHHGRGKGVRWYVTEGADGQPSPLAKILAAHRPELLVVGLGANDTAADAFYGDLASFVDATKRAGAKVIWVGPPTATDARTDLRHRAVTDALRSTLPTYGVPFVDARGMTAQLQHAPDGVHFTRTGYDTWARALAPQILALTPRSTVLAAVLGAAGGLVAGALVVLGVRAVVR